MLLANGSSAAGAYCRANGCFDSKLGNNDHQRVMLLDFPIAVLPKSSGSICNM